MSFIQKKQKLISLKHNVYKRLLFNFLHLINVLRSVVRLQIGN